MVAENRLVVSVVFGKRNSKNTKELIRDFAERTGGKPPLLFTSDEYAPYETAILKQYGVLVVPPPTGKQGRPKGPYREAPPNLAYATVRKVRKKGRVVKVYRTVVFGTLEQVYAVLEASTVSETINTSFVERFNGTDRCFNSRKVRQTYEFSKELDIHEAASWFGLTVYNFCRPNRGLDIKSDGERIVHRTPAMAAGLTSSVLSLGDIMYTQLFDFDVPQEAK